MSNKTPQEGFTNGGQTPAYGNEKTWQQLLVEKDAEIARLREENESLSKSVENAIGLWKITTTDKTYWREECGKSIKEVYELRARIKDLERATSAHVTEINVRNNTHPFQDNRKTGIPEIFEGVIYKHRRYDGEGVPALRTDWGNYEIHPEDYDWAKQHYDEKVKAREMHDCYKTVRLIIH